jgi:hypothetical protein
VQQPVVAALHPLVVRQPVGPAVVAGAAALHK